MLFVNLHNNTEVSRMSIHESGEMYLETILTLSKYTPHVRAIDIGEHMGYSKPSVSRAVGLLKADGFIKVGEDGGITLTETGRAIAEKIYERHQVLTDFFKMIGVEEETAMTDACKMEHIISDETFDAIKSHIEKMS